MLDHLAALLRAVLYAGLLTSAGSLLAVATLPHTDAFAHHAEQLLRRGVLCLVSSSIAGAWVLALRLGGEFDAPTLTAIFSSAVGATLFVQLIGVLLLLTVDASLRGTRLAAAALLPLSLAFSGHAATAGLFESVVVFAHVTLAAWWVGSLWLLHRLCVQGELRAIVATLVTFSKLAVPNIAVLIVTGLLLVYSLVDFSTLPALRPYERHLLLKLMVVVCALAIATYNKFRLTPRILAHDSRSVATLRRSIEAELALIAAVLIATAMLTTYASPHE